MLNVFKKSSEVFKSHAPFVISGSLNEDMNFLEGHPDAVFILNTRGEILRLPEQREPILDLGDLP